MDIKEAIYSRRAVRAYTAHPIDEAVLRQLIDAAIQAPSAVNRQPWSFCVVRDPALLSRISKESKAYLLDTARASLASRHVELLGDPDFDIFYHAPAMVLIGVAEAGPWAVEDCALAAENLMLAARAAGLGTCWIGFAQAWLGTAEGKAALGLPEAFLPVAPIIIGHPRAFPPPVERKVPEIRWIGG